MTTTTTAADEAAGAATGLGNVIVTGGASGLGAATARAIAKAGGTPVVLDVNRPSYDVDHELVDIGDTRAAERTVQAVAERLGVLNAVITAAGIDACGALNRIDGAAWDRVIAVNLMGTAAVVRAALPHLERAKGRVITVASTLGLKAAGDATAYCASKFGVVGFSRALSIETAGKVGVTCLIPGGMHTNFFEGRDPQYKPGPDAKLNQPEDVAEAILFALRQPFGCEVRELVICPAVDSYP